MTPTRSRTLTAGEIALARSIFGDAIDTSQVELVRGKWWPFQPRNTVMAPNGSIYFPPEGGLWREDYSQSDLWTQAFVIHELMHVVQSQQRGRFYLPLMRHPFCKYRYTLVPGRRFEDYGLEQQAEIVRHVFLLRNGVLLQHVAALEQLEALLPF